MREKLSRIISRALRHAPDEYGLVLDSRGWASLESLLEGIKIRHADLGITEGDIESISLDGERFEREPGRIRARYGHSHVEIDYGEPQPPPMQLFHATSTRAFADIASKGLVASRRKYVHLTASWEYVYRIYEQRKDETGGAVILVVAAADAQAQTGGLFLKASESIWLTPAVGLQFLYLAVLDPRENRITELQPLLRVGLGEVPRKDSKLRSLLPDE